MSQGTNLDLLLSTDYLSTEDEKLLKAEQEKEKISLGEGISLAIKQEQILPSILKSFSQPELEPDYDFRIDDELFDQLSKDIEIDYWDEFSNATSKAQAFQIRQRILDSQEANKKLSTLGFTGTALRVGAAILDPAALAADVVTFGVARPFIYANKASRFSKYIKSGFVGAGQASLVTAPVIMNDPTRDMDEIAYAALMGGAITSGLTRFLGPKHPDLNKFDSKSKDLGRAYEKSVLKNDGYNLTPKGEKYFGPDRPVTKSTYTDEVDKLLPSEKSIKPTNKNIYSKAEKEIVTSIKRSISEVDLPIPTKFKAGDSIKFFDDDGKQVERKVISVSGTGKSVKVKIGNKEKIISLEDGSSSFINFKNPNYIFRAAGTKFQRRNISDLKKEELEELRLDLQNKKIVAEKREDVGQGYYKDISKDLKAVEYSLNVLPARKVDEVVTSFFDRLDITPNVAFAKYRGDKSSVLRRSASPYTRSMSEKLAEEAVGNVDSSRSIITADAVKNNYATTVETLFYKSYAPAFQKYMKEVKGKKFGNEYNINDRLQFSDLVSRGVRGEIIDVAGVQEGVLATRKVLKKY